MTEVVVFGAGGGTGLRIVEEAVRAGHEVIAAVRDPSKLALDGVEVVAAAGCRDGGGWRRSVDRDHVRWGSA